TAHHDLAQRNTPQAPRPRELRGTDGRSAGRGPRGRAVLPHGRKAAVCRHPEQLGRPARSGVHRSDGRSSMSLRTPFTPVTMIDPGADSDEDLAAPTAALEARLEALRERRRDIGQEVDERRAVDLALDEAALLVQLERGDEARRIAREAFDRAMTARSYDQAVRACELVFLADREDALAALGQGVWLAVTFPMDPELTLSMLRHVVDETPDDADGAAVAAAAGAYVVDLRADDGRHAD